jgi:amino acid transporter
MNKEILKILIYTIIMIAISSLYFKYVFNAEIEELISYLISTVMLVVFFFYISLVSKEIKKLLNL